MQEHGTQAQLTRELLIAPEGIEIDYMRQSAYSSACS